MRTTFDRIRQAVSFEVIGLLIITPLGSLVFGFPMHEIGLLAFLGATLATGWNYLFNLGFDHLMKHLRGTARKTPVLRVVHAVFFEAGLLAALLPVFAWYLGVGLWHALVMDLSFALFYVVYAFIFTWGYEQVFPIPE